MKKKFLVCVDAHEYSKMALKYAANLAKKNKNSIDLIHVIEPVNFQGFLSVADKMRQEKRDETEALMQGCANEVNEWASITPSLIIKEGEIVEQIVNTIKEDDSISMLILGTSPESGKHSKLLPDLISQLHSKLMIPLVAIPGNISESLINDLT